MIFIRIWQSNFVRYLTYSALVVVATLLVMQFPVWGSLNNLIGDLLQGEVIPRQEIVILAIDDASLETVGAWPWNRQVFAAGLEKVLAGNPSVVGVDVLFLESREGDESMRQLLAKPDGAKVILGSKLADGEILQSIYKDQNPRVNEGYVNFISGVDGKIRTANLWQVVDGKCELSLALSVYAKYLSVSKEQIQNRCANNTFDQLELRGRSVQTERGQVAFTYATSTYQRISFADVLSGKVEPTTFKDKIVMVGSTALDLRSNLNDNFVDIFGQSIPGISIHSNIVNSFLQERFLYQPPAWVIVLTLFSLCLVLSVIYSRINRDVLDFVMFLVAFIIQAVLILLMYYRGWQWPLLTSSMVLAVNYLFTLIYRFVNKSKENRYVKQAFSRYLSGKLLGKLLENPAQLKLGGTTRNMTVLFSDIRSFTTISEGLSSEQLVQMLNDYLNYMTNIILSFDGTIDKYIGDAIMAIWNAPLDDEKHAEHGLQAALGMKSKLAEFVAANPQYPLIQIGIGLNTGDMTVGNVGGDARFDYTVLGDNVNLGARLEGLTKKYGVTILCTQATVDAYKGEGIIFRRLDVVKVKGKNQAVTIYEPLEDTPANQQIIEGYTTAFAEYEVGEFNKAEKLISKLSETDTASAKLRARIEELQSNPPKSWGGIWTWDEK